MRRAPSSISSLLGPNIDDPARNVRERLQFQFIRTDYEIVTLDTEFHSAAKRDLQEVVTDRCRTLSGPTLLYVSSPKRVREIARWLLDASLRHGGKDLDDAAKWISDSYHPQWLAARAFRNGIGIHHGKMPRALAHHMVRLFNEGRLPWLIVTSTLIEGVNTVAKNVVIVDKKIGKRNFDFFTYSNISGRSGRMFRHFVGKVIVYCEPPEKQARTVDVPAYSQGPTPHSASSSNCRGTSFPQLHASGSSPTTSSSPSASAPSAPLPESTRRPSSPWLGPCIRIRMRGPAVSSGPDGQPTTSYWRRVASSSSYQVEDTAAARPRASSSPSALISSASTAARSAP
jgi:hypothetical protein